MKLKQRLQEFTRNKRGLLATNFYNLETLQGVLAAAKEMQMRISPRFIAHNLEHNRGFANLGHNRA